MPVSKLGVTTKLADRLSLMGIESVLDVLQHYPRRYHDRTVRADIAELAIGQEATVFAEVRRIAARRSRQGRAIVDGGRVRRNVVAQRRVLQPGLARTPTRGRYGGRVLRQGRGVQGQASAHQPGRRRTRQARREHRHRGARLPPVGQGRRVHLAAAQDRRVGARLGPDRWGDRGPARRVGATRAEAHGTAVVAREGASAGRPRGIATRATQTALRRVPAHAGRSRRPEARDRSGTTGDPPRRRRRARSRVPRWRCRSR